ncbi:MAG: cation:proton antiporter [Cryobacterium sp.]|nr:cation:proton antiporter [Oligoflexia bacterium]
MSSFLIVLGAMVLVVPLCKRIGLGAVLGYLVAGALIGPHGFSLLEPSFNETSELAELGVIMMLLLIGLELSPQLLWKMRGPIFGLGGVQMISTVIVSAVILMALGTSWQTSVTIGMILAASSTAVVLQTLKEKGYAKSVGGERAFSVLLFQDMAIVPILALLPLLGANSEAATGSPLKKTLLILAAVGAVVAAGRLLIRPLFQVIARTKVRETFTALALLIVVGSATLMHFVGLSPALGAFLAGVVLADSEFRHQIEADIEPFKGLLLGLFFITIGANIHFSVIRDQPFEMLGWVVGIITVKGILVYGVGRLFRMRPPESLLFGVSLAQGGEFAFVLLGQAGQLITPATAQILTAAVALTMAIAPLLIGIAIKHGLSRFECAIPKERAPDTVDESEKENPVLVIGIGRFGQTLVRFLRALNIRSTVLDIDSEQIEIIARFGIRSYFGDGSNLDLLRAAGIENAKALVIAVDEPETAIRIAEDVKQAYPHLKIFSRAYDRVHAYRLLHAGVHDVAIETVGSSVLLATGVLQVLGMSRERAMTKALFFQKNNHESLRSLAAKFHEQDQDSFIQTTRQMAEQLETLLQSDPEKLQYESEIAKT